MKTDVRALIRANGVMELYYNDDQMIRGRGYMRIDLQTIKQIHASWPSVRRAFAEFAEGDRREIKRLLDMLIFK